MFSNHRSHLMLLFKALQWIPIAHVLMWLRRPCPQPECLASSLLHCLHHHTWPSCMVTASALSSLFPGTVPLLSMLICFFSLFKSQLYWQLFIKGFRTTSSHCSPTNSKTHVHVSLHHVSFLHGTYHSSKFTYICVILWLVVLPLFDCN